MVVGALRLSFVIASSPKSEAQKIKDRIWSKFKASVAELPSSSNNEVCLGVSIVGIDTKTTKERLDKILNHLNDWGAVELVDHDLELIQYNDLALERDFEKYDP